MQVRCWGTNPMMSEKAHFCNGWGFLNKENKDKCGKKDGDCPNQNQSDIKSISGVNEFHRETIYIYTMLKEVTCAGGGVIDVVLRSLKLEDLGWTQHSCRHCIHQLNLYHTWLRPQKLRLHFSHLKKFFWDHFIPTLLISLICVPCTCNWMHVPM